MAAKDADFVERLRVAERVRKLLALANDQPDTPEGKSARERAGILIGKYNLDKDSLYPKHVVPRTNFDYTSAVMAAMKSAFPGKDTTDYSQYDEEGNWRG